MQPVGRTAMVTSPLGTPARWRCRRDATPDPGQAGADSRRPPKSSLGSRALQVDAVDVWGSGAAHLLAAGPTSPDEAAPQAPHCIYVGHRLEGRRLQEGLPASAPRQIYRDDMARIAHGVDLTSGRLAAGGRIANDPPPRPATPCSSAARPGTPRPATAICGGSVSDGRWMPPGRHSMPRPGSGPGTPRHAPAADWVTVPRAAPRSAAVGATTPSPSHGAGLRGLRQSGQAHAWLHQPDASLPLWKCDECVEMAGR